MDRLPTTLNEDGADSPLQPPPSGCAIAAAILLCGLIFSGWLAVAWLAVAAGVR